MSYTIDVYRRKMPAVTSLLTSPVSSGSFPKWSPVWIVRGRMFLPQLQSLRQFADVDVRGARPFSHRLYQKSPRCRWARPSMIATSRRRSFDAASWIAMLFIAQSTAFLWLHGHGCHERTTSRKRASINFRFAL
jgi:hypothetical protein